MIYHTISEARAALIRGEDAVYYKSKCLNPSTLKPIKTHPYHEAISIDSVRDGSIT